MKRLVSLILAALLLCACAGSALAVGFDRMPTHVIHYQDYTQWPVVPEGENLEVTIMVKRNDSYGIDADKMWFWNFLPEATGITFKVEQVGEQTYNERVNLYLASNSLPDIIWGGWLSAADLVLYGDEEHLLLDIAPYVNEDVMPNLVRLNNEFFPTLIADATTPSGGMYSLPLVAASNPGGSRPMFINKDYMADAGYTEVPDTLDAFVDMLYGMKKAHPEITPLGGSWKSGNPIFYILNAFGFLGETAGFGITVHNGEAVIPAYDPLYKEVLALLNQFYNDGIISRDFFTNDETANKANIAEGKVGVMPYTTLTLFSDADYEKYIRWESATPLTSEYSDTRMYYRAAPIIVGNCIISSQVQNPEAILRFLDAFYAHEIYIYLGWGPEWGADEGLGMIGGWAIQDWNVKYLNTDGSDYESINAYIQHVSGYSVLFGNGAFSMDHPKNTPKQFKFFCFGDDIDHPQYDEYSSNGYSCLRMEKYVSPYERPGFPTIMYLDVDTGYERNELNSVLSPYVEEQVAQFVTGQRSLDEFDAYRRELEGLGMEDYLKIYQDYWAAYSAN